MIDPIVAALRRGGGKSHKWFARDAGGKVYDGIQSRCGMKARREDIYVPKYAYAPTCRKCARTWPNPEAKKRLAEILKVSSEVGKT